jgi:hypothetical protein
MDLLGKQNALNIEVFLYKVLVWLILTSDPLLTDTELEDRRVEKNESSTNELGKEK